MRRFAAGAAGVLWSGALLALHAQAPAAPLAPPKAAPTVDQILSLERVGSPELSPDGRYVAYTVRHTDWAENAYDTQIWLATVDTGATRQLTWSKKSSLDPAWAPGGRALAFVSDRTDQRQVYVIDLHGGEARAVTAAEDGVRAFAWSPDGRSIAYTAAEPRPAALKERDKRYGEFDIVGADYRMTHLFVIAVAPGAEPRELTAGDAYTVGRFAWSPDGKSIAFDRAANPSPGNSGTSDISVVSVADGSVRDLVTQPGPDTHPIWSPDGSHLAFETAMGSPGFYYTNGKIASIPAAGGPIDVLTADFDEDPSLLAWTPSGLFFSASSHTSSYLYRMASGDSKPTRLAPASQWVGSGFSLSRDGATVAFLGGDSHSMPEVFVAPTGDLQPRGGPPASMKRLTRMNDQTVGWTTGTLEVVSWKSQDGTTIEGVLHRPPDFQPSRRYPLLVVIHGGPTGVSRPVPFTSSIYPIDVWVPRGVLVLEPNYRGSAGYGERFRSLNVRNLGIGDAWDVLSGIDSLIGKGMVDPARVGVMGWSQGGYISAFLATHDSARFRAISVGAGISDWTTYYVNTDIHPFTRQYLKATPWDDPAIYARTSPITYIKQARAPVLIQHGATDQRVPLPDAFELYQGLQDQHVPVKLIVYKGFGGIGHGPSRPKSHRATMEHNLEWFDKYLFEAAARPSSGR